TNPFGFRSRIFSIEVLAGSSSANTPHSRIRRAINCEYCPPKSRTRTSSTAPPVGGAVGGTLSCVVAGEGGSPTATGPTGRAPSSSVIRDGNPRRNSRTPATTYPHRLRVLQLLPLAHQ